MKPARFILNSDYATVRNTGHKEIAITIPNDFTTAAGSDYYVIGQGTATLGSASDSFLVYYTSSKFNYASFGPFGSTKPSGSSSTYEGQKFIDLETVINGTTATFTVRCNKNSYTSARWRGYGQTITAHILTFKDPFSE